MSPVPISEKDYLFEIENAHISINLAFYVPYKKHIHFRIKGILSKKKTIFLMLITLPGEEDLIKVLRTI